MATTPAPLDAPELDASCWTDEPASRRATRAARARQASTRRRLVDPTTCDRDYSEAELEFLHAMQAYKARSGRMFPTWSEVLEVVRSLGYDKRTGAGADPQDGPGTSSGCSNGRKGRGPVDRL